MRFVRSVRSVSASAEVSMVSISVSEISSMGDKLLPIDKSFF